MLRRAAREGVPGFHLSTKTHPRPADLDAAIEGVLVDHGVELVVLAGYMRMLGPRVLGRYLGRVLNVHPALLPAYGGRGMYGERVHAAVLAAGERVTGVTVHLVDEEYDQGPIVAQAEVPVLEGDTVESLQACACCGASTSYTPRRFSESRQGRSSSRGKGLLCILAIPAQGDL